MYIALGALAYVVLQARQVFGGAQQTPVDPTTGVPVTPEYQYPDYFMRHPLPVNGDAPRCMIPEGCLDPYPYQIDLPTLRGMVGGGGFI